jgi:hypothetical protein
MRRITRTILTAAVLAGAGSGALPAQSTLQGWLFMVAASMIGVVGILALWSTRHLA